MAAVVEVLSYHGAGPTGSPITNQQIHFKRGAGADNDTADLVNPVDIPTSGSNYSWGKYTKINLVSGLVGQIGNIRWFADEAPEDWANSVVMYADVKLSYTQPSAADEAGLISGLDNVDTYTAASPKTVNAAANAITAPGTGSQDFMAQQMVVLSTSTSGQKTARRIVYRFNES